jgi:hypothetical protein
MCNGQKITMDSNLERNCIKYDDLENISVNEDIALFLWDENMVKYKTKVDKLKVSLNIRQFLTKI